jgi:glycosyltransferase involved in cell wall biosynthesis
LRNSGFCFVEAFTRLIRQHHFSTVSSHVHMKVLWIPHKDWPSLDGQRERWLLDSWPDSDDDLHVLTWQPARECRRPLSSFGWSTFRQERITVHSRPRIPNVMGRHVMGRFGKDYSRGLWANEQLFRFYASQLVRKLGIDVLVYGLGHQAVGLPPFDLPVARVFDCLDLIIYPDVEAAYIANSDLVFCTSRVLIDRLQKFGKKGVYVPNGVNTNRIASGQRDRTRAELGVQGKRVISLIGLTSSPSLFFVDALALAAQQMPDIVFLVVGGGDLLRPIMARCQNVGLPFVTTGWVPNNKVADYFAANVRLSPPDPTRFASAITTSLREPTKFADISEFEWARLAQTVQQTLVSLIQERRQ